MNILKPSISIKIKPIQSSSLETEGLFGETVEIFDNHLEWVYCKLLTDNYYGWIKKKNLGHLKPVTHRVVSPRSFLLKKKDIKSTCINYLPLGAQLSIKTVINDWAEVDLNKDVKNKIAYIPSKHISNINSSIKDWVSTAESLIGTPYKWGGRDSIGLDCSALLQLSYQTYGQNIPRNTIDQVMLQKEKVNDINELDRGCVIFWEGHVGIMIDKFNCVHANAFHMKTVIEPLDDIINRMGKKNKIIKMMNFN